MDVTRTHKCNLRWNPREEEVHRVSSGEQWERVMEMAASWVCGAQEEGFFLLMALGTGRMWVDKGASKHWRGSP